MLTPTITPFSTVDANEHFYIKFEGDLSSTVDNRFLHWRFIVTNLDTNTTIVSSDYSSDYNIYHSNETTDFEQYFNNLFAHQNTPYGVWSSIDKNYYFGFPKNCACGNQIIFENGYRYAIEIDFGINFSNEVTTIPYPFSCYANFRVELENYQYNDGEKTEVFQEDLLLPYNITVTKAFCKLNFSYTQEDGEHLKYYQFFLYNDKNILIGTSKKIYGIPNGGIVYGIENYNNLQHYVLKLYCVTQTDRSSTTTVNIYTNYEQENIYADISFKLDTEKATNNITISVIQLNGSGENYDYTDDDYVQIVGNGYVNFTDTYQTISKNFLCRVWCKFPNLKKDLPILKINTANNDGYIEVFFTGQQFIAYKHSCNIVTSYISNELTEVVNGEQDIYFALGYYDGRIEMYTTLI